MRPWPKVTQGKAVDHEDVGGVEHKVEDYAAGAHQRAQVVLAGAQPLAVDAHGVRLGEGGAARDGNEQTFRRVDAF